MANDEYTKEQARRIAQRLELPTDADFVEQLRQGMNVEREHDDVTHGSIFAVGQIAAAHLKEDVNYYVWLQAIEAHKARKTVKPKIEITVKAVNPYEPEQGYYLYIERVGALHHSRVPIDFATKDGAEGAKSLLTEYPVVAVVLYWAISTVPF